MVEGGVDDGRVAVSHKTRSVTVRFKTVFEDYKGGAPWIGEITGPDSHESGHDGGERKFATLCASISAELQMCTRKAKVGKEEAGEGKKRQSQLLQQCA